MDDTPRPDLVEEVRVRIPLPIVIPAVAIIVIGAAAFGISRILLNVPKNVAVALALVMAINVLGACAYVALKPTRMTSATWAELFVVLTYPIIIGAVLTQTGVAGTTAEHGEEAHQEAPGGEAAPPAEGGGEAEPSSEVEITAAEFAWDKSELAVVAGEPLTVTVENEDPTAHNFSIYEDDSLAKDFFVGDTIAASASAEEQVDPLPKGEYYFQCDLHPTMNGTLTAE
ncbi:MAG TPA: cupredoxin domain-containing protein [Actinomycetota bacterium]|jgi:plastocyanin